MELSARMHFAATFHQAQVSKAAMQIAHAVPAKATATPTLIVLERSSVASITVQSSERPHCGTSAFPHTAPMASGTSMKPLLIVVVLIVVRIVELNV